MQFNAHIIASGNIETKRFFIGDASGLANIPAGQLTGTIDTGVLPSDVVLDTELATTSGILDTKIDTASGDLQGQIDALGASNVSSISGIDGGPALTGAIVVSGYGATVQTSGSALVIEPDVRRAELVFSSPVNTAVVTHGFGERPLVQIYDTNDDQVWADIKHNSVNEVQVDFLETQTGRLIVVG